MTIVDFVLARLDEDEKRATYFDPYGAAVGPARVLAQVKAHRAIVALHEQWPVLVQTMPEFGPMTVQSPDSLAFRMSQRMQWLTEREYRDRFGSEPPTAPMLRQLATIWSDHPDYDEGWRP